MSKRRLVLSGSSVLCRKLNGTSGEVNEYCLVPGGERRPRSEVQRHAGMDFGIHERCPALGRRGALGRKSKSAAGAVDR